MREALTPRTARIEQSRLGRILSISYDPVLLLTRELMLQQTGHTVVSVEGLTDACRMCETQCGNFDLIVLGHSVPLEDKLEIIRCCKGAASCPLLALTRANEPAVKGVTLSVESADPTALMGGSFCRKDPNGRNRMDEAGFYCPGFPAVHWGPSG